MKVVLLTSADPGARTGGSLFHRRIADRAAAFGVELEVRSPGDGDVGSVVPDADVAVVDSIVAAGVDPSALGVPCVASVHQRPGGLAAPLAGRFRAALRDLRCYRGAAAVVVPSAHLGSVLRRLGVRSKRIIVVEPGSPRRRPPPRRAARGGVAFVCVANLSAHKRVLDLLDAFETLGDLDASLTLVGAAAEPRVGAAVESRLAAPGLRRRVRWVGAFAPETVEEVVRRADAFVLPALGESYGMAVAEALRLGVPAIVARSGNPPNLVRDGVDGYVVPARDPGALAAAMRRLASDPTTRVAMSAAAYAGAARFPSWDDAAARFCAVLRSVASGGDELGRSAA